MTWLGETPRPGSMLKTKREKRKRQKTPVEKRPGKNPEYLTAVRQLPCTVCDAPPPSQVHHLKSAGDRGAGKRAADKWSVSLCHDCHINGIERVGSRNEVSWFQKRGIDPLTLASSLWANKHDLRAMERVLQAHRKE